MCKVPFGVVDDHAKHSRQFGIYGWRVKDFLSRLCYWHAGSWFFWVLLWRVLFFVLLGEQEAWSVLILCSFNLSAIKFPVKNWRCLHFCARWICPCAWIRSFRENSCDKISNDVPVLRLSCFFHSCLEWFPVSLPTKVALLAFGNCFPPTSVAFSVGLWNSVFSH